MTTKEKWTYAVFVAIVAIFLDLMVTQWLDCSRGGGEFVRGVIWFKCIK